MDINTVRQLATQDDPITAFVSEARSRYAHDARNEFYDLLTAGVIHRAVTPGSVAVDVGCHVGQVLDIMLDRSPRRVYAFEPIPNLFEILERNYGDREDVVLSQLALSDERTSKQFHWVTSNPGYSGFKERHYDRPNEQIELIDVATAPLDEVVEADDRVAFIKIDVEGAELEVLEGATRILDEDRPVVVFEHGLGGADYYGTTPDDLHALLCDRHGLKISLLDRYLCGEPSLDLAGFRERFSVNYDYYYVAYP